VSSVANESDVGHFAPVVRTLLDWGDLSRRDLARRLEVDPAHVTRLLRGGDRRPTPGLMERVAAILEISPEVFVEYREWLIAEAARSDPGLRERLFRQLPR
jgi:transcriptional regulator with XRE-family HTH domain